MSVKPIILALALVLPVSIAMPSLAQQNPKEPKATKTQPGQANSTKATPSPTENSAQMSSSSQAFLEQVAREDTAEINLAKLAMQKSQNPQVKKYAQSVLSSDPGMRQQAESVAKSEHVTIDTGINDQGQAEYTLLKTMSGKEFDQAYMQYEAKRQAMDLQLVQGEINNTKDQKVKSFASKQQPSVQKASKLSSQVASSLGQPSSQTAQQH